MDSSLNSGCFAIFGLSTLTLWPFSDQTIHSWGMYFAGKSIRLRFCIVLPFKRLFFFGLFLYFTIVSSRYLDNLYSEFWSISLLLSASGFPIYNCRCFPCTELWYLALLLCVPMVFLYIIFCSCGGCYQKVIKSNSFSFQLQFLKNL